MNYFIAFNIVSCWRCLCIIQKLIQVNQSYELFVHWKRSFCIVHHQILRCINMYTIPTLPISFQFHRLFHSWIYTLWIQTNMNILYVLSLFAALNFALSIFVDLFAWYSVLDVQVSYLFRSIDKKLIFTWYMFTRWIDEH